ncbi:MULTISPECIES: DUF960 domain-containing protein [Lacticaseibacillus]|uniref:DUF960 domain-containing protein n=2 Tax=Lacticaseibacillus TaxID=2759736 RepID=A0ABW4CGD8_9LACO|nr:MULTISPECIES: DUF960 domain-containing protein [Lacticaseibacillus]
MFSRDEARFATYGVIANLPGEIIDSVWMIIDQNLQGVLPLGNLLRFDLLNSDGQLTIGFSEEGQDTQMAFDLDFTYDDSFPDTVMAYDDGENQTILLPEETNR